MISKKQKIKCIQILKIPILLTKNKLVFIDRFLNFIKKCLILFNYYIYTIKIPINSIKLHLQSQQLRPHHIIKT
ncbi:hypothetical protein pb186bvf_005631 [Paramecium bursaria]